MIALQLRRWMAVSLAVHILVFSVSCVGASQSLPQPSWAGAWITPWEFDKGVQALDKNPDDFRDVYFFWAQLNAQGEPVAINPGLDFAGIHARLKLRQTRTWLTLVNDVAVYGDVPRALKDATVVSRLLNNDALRKTHRAQIIQMAQVLGVTGIDIDYENLLPTDRDPFSRFIEELAGDAHAVGLQLSVTVQPKRGHNRSAVGPGAADWAALCLSADRVQIMLYNEHSGKSGPGPIATTAWIDKILDYAETQCPRTKLIPALKVSGAAWSDEQTRGITYEQTLSLRREHDEPIKREAPDQVPHFAVTANGARTTVYYEDATSIGLKLNYLRTRGYRSVMLWSLGSQDPAIGARIRDYTGIER